MQTLGLKMKLGRYRIVGQFTTLSHFERIFEKTSKKLDNIWEYSLFQACPSFTYYDRGGKSRRAIYWIHQNLLRGNLWCSLFINFFFFLILQHYYFQRGWRKRTKLFLSLIGARGACWGVGRSSGGAHTYNQPSTGHCDLYRSLYVVLSFCIKDRVEGRALPVKNQVRARNNCVQALLDESRLPACR